MTDVPTDEEIARVLTHLAEVECAKYQGRIEDLDLSRPPVHLVFGRMMAISALLDLDLSRPPVHLVFGRMMAISALLNTITEIRRELRALPTEKAALLAPRLVAKHTRILLALSAVYYDQGR